MQCIWTWKYFRIRITAKSSCEGQQQLESQLSGDEVPTNFATEGTPTQFSRNESLSDLSNVEEESGGNGQVVARASIVNEGKSITYRINVFDLQFFINLYK